MKKFRRFKNILLTAAVAVGITFFAAQDAFAATYKVVAGDTLYKISQVYNTTTTNLINDNELSSSSIYPGQILYVSSKTYTVQSGDSLYLIAQKYGTTVDIIRRANNIWTNNIYVGQVVNIPVTTTTTTSTVTAATSQYKGISYTASDVDLLARLIMAEAQGESYQAKVAVGGVVVNRVKSSTFPNTISGVIYQTVNGYYQFTPVLNGWINRPADSDSIKAAYEALNGNDPTNGALFYFDNTVTNQWLRSKPVSIIIGNLIFAY